MKQLISEVMYSSKHFLLVNTLWEADPVNLVILLYFITFFVPTAYCSVAVKMMCRRTENVK
jgi:hypothetical protein